MSQPNHPFKNFASCPIPSGENTIFFLTTAFEIFPCLRTIMFLLALLSSVINKPNYFMSSVSLITLVSPPYYNCLTFFTSVVPERDHREWVRHDTIPKLLPEPSWMQILEITSSFIQPRARSVFFATMWCYSFTSVCALWYCWNLSYGTVALPRISDVVLMRMIRALVPAKQHSCYFPSFLQHLKNILSSDTVLHNAYNSQYRLRIPNN